MCQPGSFFDQSASTNCLPSVSDQNVKATEPSSSLFNDKSTEIFIVQIAWDARESQIFARQQILEVLSIRFLAGPVVDSNVRSFAGECNDCCATDARVAACDEHVETLQSSGSLVAVFAAIRWNSEVGLEDGEAGRGKRYFVLGEAIDGVDELDSLCSC